MFRQIKHLGNLRRSQALLLLGVALVLPLGRHAGAQATALVMPVAHACISSPFGTRIMPDRPKAGSFHNGIDLPAPIGSPVMALAPGKIIRIQRHGVGGLEILVQHGSFIGVYSHLGLIVPNIAEGSRTVYRGEKLGTVGRSGLTYGPHLYLGMIVDGRSVDPALYLGIKPCPANPRKEQ